MGNLKQNVFVRENVMIVKKDYNWTLSKCKCKSTRYGCPTSRDDFPTSYNGIHALAATLCDRPLNYLVTHQWTKGGERIIYRIVVSWLSRGEQTMKGADEMLTQNSFLLLKQNPMRSWITKFALVGK